MLLHVVEPVLELGNIEVSYFSNVLAPNLIRQSLFIQPHTMTLGAFFLGNELRSPLLALGTVVVL